MDAKAFGSFLAETRKARGLTQSALAEQLNVTDKAVSRWERGLGFPDINTLEPLADALGLTLSQLMHADPGDGSGSDQSLEDFFTMLSPGRIQWQTFPSAIFWLTVAVAVAVQFALPLYVTVNWAAQSNGVLLPQEVWPRPIVYLVCVGLSALFTQIWKNVEQRSASINIFVLWWQTFHPKLAPWMELIWHLFYATLALGPLFAEVTIYLFNQ